MTITSFHVQNILRTYARQLSRGQRLARNRAANQATQNDQVNISIEARRKQVIEKITSEIVSSIGSRVPGMAQGMGGLEEQALQQLSKEYGKHLDIYQDAGSGQLMFRVVEDQTGKVVENLDAEKSVELQERLYQITQSIVDSNMV
jgi:hypothetical protein